MKILLAFDSFKESLSSLEAAGYFQEGFLKIYPDAFVKMIPISDGGEGFIDALIYKGGDRYILTVTGPLSNSLTAPYGFLPDNKTAIIEMASASGLEQVPAEYRNPLKTTTYGTGELIKTAMSKGARHIYVGLGGSATVDGGTGMAQALGVQFFDKAGKLIKSYMNGGDLINIGHISLEKLSPLVQQTQFTSACDVTAPLLGDKGAARVFGPQKGATPEMVERLESGLHNLAEIMQRDLGRNIRDLPGVGAAGGLGGMLYGLLNAKLKSGIEIVLETADFENHVKQSDLIVTGEGKVDSQTAGGKTISGIVKVSQKNKVPVLIIGGSIVNDDLPLLYKAGIDATLPLITCPMQLSEALKQSDRLMREAGERTARLIRCFSLKPC